jgi:hypothetical protein
MAAIALDGDGDMTEPRMATSGAGAARGGPTAEPGIEVVPARAFAMAAVVARIPLQAGDHATVEVGQAVRAGDTIIERARDAALEQIGAKADADWQPGHWLPAERRGRWPMGRRSSHSGELVFVVRDHWWLATSAQHDPVEAPGSGIVRAVRPGTALELALSGHAVPAAFAVGAPVRGRLELGIGPDGEPRSAGIDVTSEGAIIVLGPRADAEQLIRARAMGVRGVVVASISQKDLRDFEASERRQRSSAHRLTPFAILVLDGYLRRPIASPIRELLAAAAGRDVAVLGDPPSLLIDQFDVAARRPGADWVRVRHGPLAGREGRWAGSAGRRRFPAGVQLEAGFVRFDDGPSIAVPLGDLERFV